MFKHIKKYMLLCLLLACSNSYSRFTKYTVIINTQVSLPFYFGITAAPCADHEGVMISNLTDQVNIQRKNDENAKGVPVYVGSTNNDITVGGCLAKLTFRYPDDTEGTVNMNGVNDVYNVTVYRKDNGQYDRSVTNVAGSVPEIARQAGKV